MGEKENLTPGLSGSFSLKLDGRQVPGLLPERQDREDRLHGHRHRAAAPPPTRPWQTALTDATTGYQQYVAAEVDKLVPATKTFTDAVRAGDLAAAKAAFAPARYFYEEVEPVAESFGDLDPDIDARDRRRGRPGRLDRLPPAREGALGRQVDQEHGADRRPSSTPTWPS